jgi:hypothetical protein
MLRGAEHGGSKQQPSLSHQVQVAVLKQLHQPLISHHVTRIPQVRASMRDIPLRTEGVFCHSEKPGLHGALPPTGIPNRRDRSRSAGEETDQSLVELVGVRDVDAMRAAVDQDERTEYPSTRS